MFLRNPPRLGLSRRNFLEVGAAAGLLYVLPGCSSSSDDASNTGAEAAYDKLLLGSLNGFGLDQGPNAGVGIAVLNNKRQIAGIRAGTPHGQPYLFEGGTFFDVLPPGEIDPNGLTLPQLNEAGELYFPSVIAQMGAFRTPNNVWTRVPSRSQYGNEYITNVRLADDGALYGVRSQAGVPFQDPSTTMKWQNGTWTDLSVIPDLPPVNGNDPTTMDGRAVRGVARDGKMVMTHIAAVTTGGNGLPKEQCWIQNLDGSRVDLLALVVDGWGLDPLGINDLGQVAGTMTLGSNGFNGAFPFLYKGGTEVFTLGTEAGEALAMNNVGDVLYQAAGKTMLYRADGTRQDLTSVFAADTRVYGMNDARDLFVSNAEGAFLLTPKV